MDDFLTKPVRAEVLEDVLRDIETRAGRPQRAPDGASAGEAETVPADTFDRRVLDELREALGDTDGAFVRELVDAFTAQAPGLVEQIEQAIAAGDREALRFSAHTLKGSSGSVGAVRLAALSDRLEHQDEGLSDLPPVVASVHVELRAVVETLQNYVDGR
ncbi:MAG: Hpt domain-containing protein [Actinomycetota bacterium]|nr:Hpt domain-containing protein [Actinomycetota bacterium]